MTKFILKGVKWIVLLLITLALIFTLVIFYEKGNLQKINFTGIKYQECWTESLKSTDSKCGLMSVPVSYDESSGPHRAFSFARLPALNKNTPQATEKPLVFLIGGPGPAGTYYADVFAKGGKGELFRKNRELILVDYRGSGMSIPHASCEIPNGPAGVIACVKSIYVADNNEFRSAIFARDINNLIKALGYESVVLYGASYGTRLALTMMRDTPEHISHVIIDGVFPVHVNGYSQGSQSILAGLSHIAERCQSDPLCQNKFGSIKVKLEDISIKWRQREDKKELFSALAQFAYFQQAPLLINILSAQTADEGAELLRQVAGLDKDKKHRFAGRSNSRSMSVPLALSVICSEEVSFIQQQPFDKRRHGFSETFVSMFSNIAAGAPIPVSVATKICPLFAMDKADEIEMQAVKSQISTLILSGGMDLQTSFEWGELVSNNLTNSQHHVLPYSDHLVLFDEDNCGRSLIEQFMANPHQQLDVKCLQAHPTIPLTLEAENLSEEFKHPYK